MLAKLWKTWGPAIVVLLVIFLLVFCSFLWVTRAPRKFYRAYYALEAGMTLKQIEELFRRPPDYACDLSGLTVVYFRRGAVGDPPADLEALPESVSSREDLPVLYGYGQLLLDAEGTLIAYTCVYEEVIVHTSLGDFPGSRIQDLDDATFQQLTES